MMKIIGKFLLGTLLAAFLLLVVVSGYIYINFDEIKQEALSKVNTYLKVKAHVNNIDITLWNSFPQVSLLLEGVHLDSPSNFSDDSTLLDCKTIAVVFDFWEIFNGNYRFKKIKVEEGNINLVADKSGNVNFDIIRSSGDSGSTNPDIHLREVLFNNIAIQYKDLKHEIHTRAKVHQLVFSGNFKEKTYEMGAKINTMLEEIVFDKRVYRVKEELKLDLQLSINRSTNIYKILTGTLQNDQLNCNLTGSIATSPLVNFDLHFEQQHGDLRYLIRFLPKGIQDQVVQYSVDGEIDIRADIKGPFTETKNPVINFYTEIKNGTLISPDKKLRFDHIGFILTGVNESAAYPMGMLSIQNFTTAFKNSTLRGSAMLSDFSSPSLDLKFLCSGKTADITPFLGSSMKLNGGDYDCEVSVSSTLEAIKASKYEEMEIRKFVLQTNHLAFDYQAHRFEDISVNARLDGESLVLNQIHFLYNSQPVQVSCQVARFLPFLLKGVAPTIEGSIEFDQLKLSSAHSAVSEKTPTNAVPLPDMHWQIKGNELVLEKNIIQKPVASLSFEKGIFSVSDCHFGIYNGQIDIQHIKFDQTSRQLFFDGNLKQIDINKMFVGLDNFHQSTLTDKNISGTLHIKHFTGKLPLDNNYKPLYDQLILEADMNIENGRLINFEPIYKLSKFIKVEELSDIHFADLSNVISIHDNNIYIPEMQITNNALNLQMSGIHGFNNDLEYHLKILLKDLLLKKRRLKTNEAFDEYEEVSGKGTYLYILIAGNMDNIKIKYDKKNAQKAVASKIKEEKKIVKNLFRKELGDLNDKKLNPRKADTIQTAPQIIWDEDGQ